MSQIAQKWLLVQWNSGSRDVIHADAVDTPEDELSIGCRLTVSRRGEAEPRVGTLIDRSNARSFLIPSPREAVAGPSTKPDDKGEDSSLSCSAWSPCQEENSEDSGEEIVRKLNDCAQKYLSRRNQIMISSKLHIDPRLQRNNTATAASGESKKMIRIPHREIINMQLRFNVLFRLLSDLRNYNPASGIASSSNSTHDKTEKKNSRINIEQANETTERAGQHNYSSTYKDEDMNRITNKNKKIESINLVQNQRVADKKNDDKEVVQIGIGGTTVPVEEYRKVKWHSYTTATRSLLLAAFDRRVLATHSLTGKPSPAFKNKPAKMCLDQRKISDIIIEVTKRFDVKENLVRSIITTKCADECKMWKQRMRKKHSKTMARDQENKLPTAGVGKDCGLQSS